MAPVVHVTDGRILDEPLEKVWKYMGDPHAFPNRRLLRGGRVVDKKGDTIVFENVVVTEGGSGAHATTLKLTLNAPNGYDVECISGPLAGSKFTQVYTALGDRTKTEISGDFRMQGEDEGVTKKGILALLDETMTDDARNLKHYK